MTQYVNFLGELMTERICPSCGNETNDELCGECLEQDGVEVETEYDYRIPSKRHAEAHCDDED